MAAEIASRKEPVIKGFAHVALFSAGLYVLLVVLKYALGVLCGSVALRADAFHSLADVLSSLGVFAGIRISQRRSKHFPYGLYKVENLAALITSIFIFFAAYEIIKEVIQADPDVRISNTPIGVVGLMVIAVLIFLL